LKEETVPQAIKDMDEMFREARRNFPRPSELNSGFLRPREVAELRCMVEASASETELDRFIQGEPNLLSALLHFADTGHHGGMVYPQQVIRPSVSHGDKGLIPDYLISGDNSEGTSWWVLELKGPAEKIFTGKEQKIRLSDTANKGLLQIHQYIEYCSTYQSSIRETLKLKNFSTPAGILLIGRESELVDDHRKQMKKSIGGKMMSVRIRTWDSLLRSLEHKLFYHGFLDQDSLHSEQLEH
jgi:Domain of unknown function (DUF4263)